MGKALKSRLKRNSGKRREVKKKRLAIKPVRRRKFVRQGDYKVYILKCCDGSYYTGHTRDLKARLQLHESGKGSKYVRSRRPFDLVYIKSYRYFKPAFLEEFRIKRLPRSEKEKLAVSFKPGCCLSAMRPGRIRTKAGGCVAKRDDRAGSGHSAIFAG